MRARLLSLRNNAAILIGRRHYGKPPRCDAHMNELPIPCGPWEPMYKERQALYNKFFIAGLLWITFSIAMALWTDSMFFNFCPPANPGPPSDMIEECDDSED